jgi:hypothetical protein
MFPSPPCAPCSPCAPCAPCLSRAPCAPCSSYGRSPQSGAYNCFSDYEEHTFLSFFQPMNRGWRNGSERESGRNLEAHLNFATESAKHRTARVVPMKRQQETGSMMTIKRPPHIPGAVTSLPQSDRSFRGAIARFRGTIARPVTNNPVRSLARSCAQRCDRTSPSSK